MNTAEKENTKSDRNKWIATIVGALLILGAAGGFIYYRINAGRIYIEDSSIEAPLINLAPQNSSDILQEVYVKEGDQIGPNTPVARVGNEIIKSQVGGIVVNVVNNVGTLINKGQTVVTMIDPTQLRVVGELDENKGLSSIQVGDQVIFTVDAFGSKKFIGSVDEISPISDDASVVFDISDKREVKQFDVKAIFDPNLYPELKEGMSARMYIYEK